jgi:L-asparaginase II
MAWMYARLAAGQIEPSARVFDFMTGHPEMIGGTASFDTELMQVMQGRMVSKVGAEGIRCVGVRGERPLGIALKIEDGSKRASEAVMLEVLVQLNLISENELNDLANFYHPVIVNFSGNETGQILPEFKLQKRR